MSAETVSRTALQATGNALGLKKSILIPNVPMRESRMSYTRDNIAETFEAILGAIYVDSGYDLQPVSKVLKRLGLHDHRYLKTRNGQAAEEKHSETKPITTQCTKVRGTLSKASTPRRDSDTSPIFDRHIQRQIASL